MDRRDIAAAEAFFINDMTVIHEFDDFGNHRLTIPAKGLVGDWVTYTVLCQISGFGSTYYGCTDYYTGTFPSGVFEIIAAPRKK